MSKSFEDFLVELAEKGDRGVLGRIPRYLDGHLIGKDVAAERVRLADAFRDKAPLTELSLKIYDLILNVAKPRVRP